MLGSGIVLLLAGLTEIEAGYCVLYTDMIDGEGKSLSRRKAEIREVGDLEEIEKFLETTAVRWDGFWQTVAWKSGAGERMLAICFYDVAGAPVTEQISLLNTGRMYYDCCIYRLAGDAEKHMAFLESYLQE